MSTDRKVWVTPELIEYGAVEDLTQQAKWKEMGVTDDFGVPGVSDA